MHKYSQFVNKKAHSCTSSADRDIEKIINTVLPAGTTSKPTPAVGNLDYPTDEPSQEETQMLATLPIREVSGMMIWLATCTRPDIIYSVNQICRYLSRPRLAVWKYIKRIARYLKGTPRLGMCYRRVSRPHFSLKGWSFFLRVA